MNTHPIGMRLLPLVAGAVVATGMVALAGPASADPCYPPVAGCVASHGAQATASYDPATNTMRIVVGGLLPGSPLTLTIALPSGVGGAAYAGGMHVAPAVQSAGTVVSARPVALSHSFAGTAGADGSAKMAASLSTFGSLTAAQAQALVWAISGTAADGTPVSIRAAGATSGSAGPLASGVRTAGGTSSLPLTGAGVGVLVLAGGAVLLVRHRRRDSSGAHGA